MVSDAAQRFERHMVGFLLGPWAEVVVERSVLTVRCRLPETALLGQLGTSPAAEALAAASDDVRAALVAQVAREVQPFVVGDEVVFPTEANLATAHT